MHVIRDWTLILLHPQCTDIKDKNFSMLTWLTMPIPLPQDSSATPNIATQDHQAAQSRGSEEQTRAGWGSCSTTYSKSGPPLCCCAKISQSLQSL